MTPRLKKFFKLRLRLVNTYLQSALPKISQKPALIHKAMRYSLWAGGKRLRPILVMAAAEACGGTSSQVLPTAGAMELIHTYSLIHDDLPAMDDDDLRRGRPTNHKIFGEAAAILAGDALLTHAFVLIADNARRKGVKSNAVIDVSRIIAERAGSQGMIGGQVADIASEGGGWKKRKDREFPLPQKLLEFIHLNKTSALIQASLWAGGRLVTENLRKLSALNLYGRYLGLAFQVTDDVLDRIGDKKKLGKKGSDQKNQKLTFPALYGVPASQLKARHYVDLSHKALHIFGEKAAILHELSNYVLSRDR